jgi:hypothetical protein
MSRVSRVALAVSCLVLAGGLFATARGQDAAGKTYVIGLYHVAPGQQVEFLKWNAEREAIAAEAGAPPTQWYRHTNGDSWDFISIVEEPEASRQEALDGKIETLTLQKGLTTGFAAGVEFRRFIASHTDTEVVGPFTARDLVQQATGR